MSNEIIAESAQTQIDKVQDKPTKVRAYISINQLFEKLPKPENIDKVIFGFDNPFRNKFGDQVAGRVLKLVIIYSNGEKCNLNRVKFNEIFPNIKYINMPSFIFKHTLHKDQLYCITIDGKESLSKTQHKYHKCYKLETVNNKEVYEKLKPN